MTKKPILIIAANLVIVLLLSMTAYILIGSSKNENSKQDVRSSASSSAKNTVVKATVTPTQSEVEQVGDAAVSDVDAALVEVDKVDEAFPQFNHADFE
jgi:hypothetical protein